MLTSIVDGSTPGTSTRIMKRLSSSRMSTRGAHWLVSTVDWSLSPAPKKRLMTWRKSSGVPNSRFHTD